MFEILFCAIDKANGEHGYAVGQLVVMLPKGTQPKQRGTEIETERACKGESCWGAWFNGSRWFAVRCAADFVSKLLKWNSESAYIRSRRGSANYKAKKSRQKSYINLLCMTKQKECKTLRNSVSNM